MEEFRKPPPNAPVLTAAERVLELLKILPFGLEERFGLCLIPVRNRKTLNDCLHFVHKNIYRKTI